MVIKWIIKINININKNISNIKNILVIVKKLDLNVQLKIFCESRTIYKILFLFSAKWDRL